MTKKNALRTSAPKKTTEEVDLEKKMKRTTVMPWGKRNVKIRP